MKIAAIYTQSVGPLGDAEISFKNDWTGEVEENVLLTGPNGCGKSTLLRGTALLWEAFGYWLDRRQSLPTSHIARKWFDRWGAFAVLFSELKCSNYSPASFGFFFGDEAFVQKLLLQHAGVSWIGEITGEKKKNQLVFNSGFFNDYSLDEWLQMLSVTRSQVVLGMLKTDMVLSVPNIIYLDAEERRWISPKRNVSSLAPDDLNKNWLAKYVVTDDWKDQLESSLFNMKATLPEAYPEMVATLNQFLSGKRIEPEIPPGGRPLIIMSNGQKLLFDDLSSGEHQVLIMLFTVQRWLMPGGIVLIDEPDLHLHPSLIMPLLAILENIVKQRQGQLILTSHATEVWERYENLGMRNELSRLKDDENGKD